MRVMATAVLIQSSNAPNRRFGGSGSYFSGFENPGDRWRRRVGISGGWYQRSMDGAESALAADLVTKAAPQAPSPCVCGDARAR